MMSWNGFTFGSSPDYAGGGSVFIPGSTGQFPGVPSGSPGGPTNPSGSWLDKLLPWAQLGAQTFLADQAITSPRPSTVTFLPNGQGSVASGGGAPAPLAAGGLTSILGTSSIWLFAFVAVLVLVLLKK